MKVRAAAAQVLAQIFGAGSSLSTALPPALAKIEPRNRGLLQELCYGVCRCYPQLQALLQHLLTRPLDKREVTVQALLLVGLYQLRYLRIPAHAAVAETVAAARTLGKPWAVGLTNALLRSALRRQVELDALLAADLLTQTNHPAWLLTRLQEDWGAAWQDIVAANNAHPPFTLRLNRQHLDPHDYQQQLAIPCTAIAAVPSALVLSAALETQQLPHFQAGWVSVQDAAAQLAAPLLNLQPHMRILDACAAPGGKTGHILESAPDLDVTALDIDAIRLARVRDNVQRLGFKQVQFLVGDAQQPQQWWDGVPYQRILLDAPCSGTGVIRRHPDIKLLRRDSDINALAERQYQLLCALWTLLENNGYLLYATCSVLREENEQVIQRFLGTQAQAREIPIAAIWGQALQHGRQILPGQLNMDGFYYALLQKLERP